MSDATAILRGHWSKRLRRIGDADGDGYADMAVYDSHYNNVRIVSGPVQGEVSLDDVMTGYLAIGADDSTIGDFNGDGTADFALTRLSDEWTYAQDFEAWICLGPVVGTLEAEDCEQVITSEGLVREVNNDWRGLVAAGDLDGDGLDDLALSEDEYGFDTNGVQGLEDPVGATFVFLGGSMFGGR